MAKLALAKALKKFKVSKYQFAKMLGISYNNVFRLCRPGKNPKLSTLNRYAEIIGCKVRDLLDE